MTPVAGVVGVVKVVEFADDPGKLVDELQPLKATRGTTPHSAERIRTLRSCPIGMGRMSVGY